jgi:hypothetical protein
MNIECLEIRDINALLTQWNSIFEVIHSIFGLLFVVAFFNKCFSFCGDGCLWGMSTKAVDMAHLEGILRSGDCYT